MKTWGKTLSRITIKEAKNPETTEERSTAMALNQSVPTEDVQ